MTFKSHITLSFAPLIVAFTQNVLPLNVDFVVISVVGTFIGAVLPDIDEPNSYIGRRLKPVSKLLRFLNLKHRTYTHSIFFPLLIAMLGIVHFIFYFISFGAFMHIIEDFLTKGGVPLFYPIIKERFSANMFVTGGKGEYIFVFLVYFIIFGYILYTFIHRFKLFTV